MGILAGQSVLFFIAAGVATVALLFVLYWKLLGERSSSFRLQKAPVQPDRNYRATVRTREMRFTE